MKYIRTKDGRIVDLKNWSSVETICVDTKTNKTEKDICYQRSWFEYYGDMCEYKTEYISHKSQVLKQADTIEELCDGLIVEDKDNPDNWFVMEIDEYQSKDNVDKKYMVDRWNFYAFIKIDKGLIYVAKMNEKGELELL